MPNYNYRVLRRVANAAGDQWDTQGLFEAPNPRAACLAAAEQRDEQGLYVAIPQRNWHEMPIKPKRGFELAPPEGSLLSEPEPRPVPAGEEA